MSATLSDGRNAPPRPVPLSPEQIREYLLYELAGAIDRRAELAHALQATLDAYPTITDDDAMGEVAENRRMAEGLLRMTENRRKDLKEPFLEGGRTVDAWFRGFAEPLRPLLDQLCARMDDYAAQKEAAERKRAAEEASRRAEQAALAQAEADAARRRMRGGALFPDDPETIAVLERADTATREAQEAHALATGRPADLTRVTGVYGAVTSTRLTWDFEVTDIGKVPAEYLTVDAARVKLAMKDKDRTGKPKRVIPGIAWIPVRKTLVR